MLKIRDLTPAENETFRAMVKKISSMNHGVSLWTIKKDVIRMIETRREHQKKRLHRFFVI